MSERVTNWAGNITFSARRLHRPRTVGEVAELIARGGPLRVLGSGHSFNRMADTTGDLVSLAGLPRLVEVAADRRSVRTDGGIRYAELAQALHAQGLALHNMASLPHISVAGAIATATHGSGVRHGNLAAAVAAVDFLDGAGRPVTLRRGDDGFDGIVVGLWSAGVVTSLTLDVVPAFELRQYVYDDIPRATLQSNLEEMLADGYSVSLFTNWASTDINHAWVKRAAPMTGDWFGASPATAARHPVPGMPATNSTEQFGKAGPWFTRLPHFRPEFTPSNGTELQSEWHVARADALAAIDAVAAIREQVAPVLQVCELRTVAADELWLSPNYRRDSLAMHFTWLDDAARVLPVVKAVEERLAPLAARPHWGKVFAIEPSELRTLYARFDDFRGLVQRYDPESVLQNPWSEAVLKGLSLKNL